MQRLLQSALHVSTCHKLSHMVLQHHLRTFSMFFFKIIEKQFFTTSKVDHHTLDVVVHRGKNGEAQYSGVKRFETKLTFYDLTRAVWSAARSGLCNFGSPCPIPFLHALLWWEGVHTSLSSLVQIIEHEPDLDIRNAGTRVTSQGFVTVHRVENALCDCERCCHLRA